MRQAQRWWWIAAVLAGGSAVLFPIYNPDLYWHLSAGRRIVELGAIPRADWLSSTRAGAPWRDFEWLGELLFYGSWRLAGAAGLWALKALLLAGLLAVGAATAGLYGLTGSALAAELCVSGAALLPFADLRPDLFSALGVAVLFWRLEAWRLGQAKVPPVWAVLAGFALWANLHAGYAYGWLLLGLYAAASGRKGRPLWPCLAAALAGACLQPGGPAAFDVLRAHWSDLSGISGLINEWAAPAWRNSWHWPYFGALAVFLLALGGLLSAGKRPAAAPAAVGIAFAVLAARHVRLALFFFVAGLPVAAGWLWEYRRRKSGRAAPALAAALCALAILYALKLDAQERTLRRFVRPLVDSSAAEFLLQERAALGGRAVYSHAFAWGGYLGWRLWPDYTIFADGRYLFHGLLLESRQAQASPQAWNAFLDRYGVTLVLLQRSGPGISTVRLYPDGSTRRVERPYYAVFMPRERWALVEWDGDALLFVRRDSVAPSWLSDHEYRLLHPGDEAALADAVARGEADRRLLDAEWERHGRQARLLGGSPAAF